MAPPSSIPGVLDERVGYIVIGSPIIIYLQTMVMCQWRVSNRYVIVPCFTGIRFCVLFFHAPLPLALLVELVSSYSYHPCWVAPPVNPSSPAVPATRETVESRTEYILLNQMMCTVLEQFGPGWFLPVPQNKDTNFIRTLNNTNLSDLIFLYRSPNHDGIQYIQSLFLLIAHCSAKALHKKSSFSYSQTPFKCNFLTLKHTSIFITHSNFKFLILHKLSTLFAPQLHDSKMQIETNLIQF